MSVKRTLFLVSWMIGSLLCLSTQGMSQSTSLPLKKVAISQIVSHPALNETYEGIVEQLAKEGYIQGKNLEIIYKNAQGNIVTSAQIAHSFANLKPDVVIAISTPSAQTALSALKDTPIVFSSVSAPLEAKLVASLEEPGGMVTGVSNMVPFERQLKLVIQLVPHLHTLGVVCNPGEANSIATLAQMKEVASRYNIEVLEATASKTSEVIEATKSLLDRVDAFFINNDNTALAAFEAVVATARRAKKPVFASDLECVEQGAPAVLGASQREIGRQTARMVAQVLKGTPPGTMPVQGPATIELHINEKAAQQVNLAIPDAVRQQAQKVWQ